MERIPELKHILDPFHARDWFLLCLVVLLAFAVMRDFEKRQQIQAQLDILNDKTFKQVVENKIALTKLINNKCGP